MTDVIIEVPAEAQTPKVINWQKVYDAYWIKVYGLDGKRRDLTLSDWLGKQ